MPDVIVDTSALLAFFDASEPDHDVVTDVLAESTGLLVVSLFVVAELDYLLATRHEPRREPKAECRRTRSFERGGMRATDSPPRAVLSDEPACPPPVGVPLHANSTEAGLLPDARTRGKPRIE